MSLLFSFSKCLFVFVLGKIFLGIPLAEAQTRAYKPLGLKRAKEAKLNIHGNKVLIGKEGRILADTDHYPYTAIGLLTFEDEDENSYQCTGSLVSKRVVLTNGHCVWDRDTKKFYQNFTFYPAYQLLESTKYKPAKATHLSVSRGYQKGSIGIDFGFIVLDRPVGEETGWLGTKDMQKSWYDSERFYVSGYGSNYTAIPQGLTVQTRNAKPCAVTRASVSSLFQDLVHECDTGPGNSGSALFTYVNGKPYVVGVHHGGDTTESDPRVACSPSIFPGVCENNATRTSQFSEVLIDLIKKHD